MKNKKKIAAILWDYDGTLADTAYKNLEVTKEILCHLKPELKKQDYPDALDSVEKYSYALKNQPNFRTFYHRCLGLTQQQVVKAAALWSDYHVHNQTPVKLFEGIPEVIDALGDIPQGICSLGCSISIRKTLSENNLIGYFKTILGYQEIETEKHKPNSYSFLSCLEKMDIQPGGTIFYIGDHHTDIEFACNAQKAFLEKANHKVCVRSIAACYGGADPTVWSVKPDYEAHRVKDILSIISAVS